MGTNPVTLSLEFGFLFENLELYTAYLNDFLLTRVLNHDKYVEIKQFSKVDIKQNNVSTVILLIKFLIYQ